MSDTNAQAAAAEPRKPEGIAGWLILPILGVALNVGLLLLFVLKQLPGIIAPPDGYWGKNFFGSGEFFSYAFVVFTAGFAAFGIYSLVATFQRKRQAPLLMMVFFSLLVLWSILNAAGLWFFGSDEELDAGMTNAVGGISQSLLPAAIWITYLRISARVKNTFVR